MKQPLSDGISAQERLAIQSFAPRGFRGRTADKMGTALAHAAYFLCGFAAALFLVLVLVAAAS